MGKKQKFIVKKLTAVAESASGLALALSIIAVILTGLFLYYNFYNALRDIEILNGLKSQTVSEVVDMATWEKINQRSSAKKAPLGDWESRYIPF
ncbi:MAG TPA: hypothetical protein PLR18_03085 [bacterium]|nr:hypothetical protein [bacterium]